MLTEERIRRGFFKSVGELEAAIQDYLEHHNADPKPFCRSDDARWAAPVIAEPELFKVRRP